ncbi:MAG: polyphenol oxidase family protein [Longimicrobiales bacterium]
MIARRRTVTRWAERPRSDLALIEIGSTGAAARVVREMVDAHAGLYVHPDWRTTMPWLAQGTTGRADGSVDMSWFGETPVGELQRRWREVRDATACATSIHAKQVHGAAVLWHEAYPPGALIAFEADGHATSVAGLLLTVSVADCVPVLMVDPALRVVAALHAGWRGVAAGMLEAGIASLASHAGCAAADLLVHFGPAICGDCYEVGPEVAVALGRGDPGAKVLLDVRGVLTDRAHAAGIAPDAITVSAWCTRCGDSPFFSHRAGDAERQMSVIGMGV